MRIWVQPAEGQGPRRERTQLFVLIQQRRWRRDRVVIRLKAPWQQGHILSPLGPLQPLTQSLYTLQIHLRSIKRGRIECLGPWSIWSMASHSLLSVISLTHNFLAYKMEVMSPLCLVMFRCQSFRSEVEQGQGLDKLQGVLDMQRIIIIP